MPPPRTGRPRISARDARSELDRIFASGDFDGSRRSRELLTFIVEESLAGRGEAITQATLATRVFGRRDDFDPVLDPIVRIQAGRLRRSLERYYLLSGKGSPVRIELPKGSYVAAFRAATPAEIATPRRRPTDGRPNGDWPTVEIGAFETAGAGLAEAAGHVIDTLAAELGAYRTVRVAVPYADRRQPGSGPGRFVLSGRLRRMGSRVRLTARLLDRSTVLQVWGDEYETIPKKQLAAQLDGFARVIAARLGSEEGVVVQLLTGELRSHGAVEPTSYAAILAAYDFFFRRDPAGFVPVVRALREAIEREPGCALAWTLLARLYTANYGLEAAPVSTPIDEAISHAHNGVRLDPTCRIARCTLAAGLLIRGDVESAREQLLQAIELSPGSLVYLEMIGWLLSLCGDWDRGPALLRIATTRNPCHLPHAALGLWAAHLRRGDYRRAYRAALDYRDPTFFWRSLMRACCLGHLGRTREAKAEIAELIRRKADFPTRGRILIGHYFKSPEMVDRILDGLAKAGLRVERARAIQPVA
jgi:adenylate cyclase